MKLRADGAWLRDEVGRTLLLRGVNLGGDCKVPVVPDGTTHQPEHFFDHRMVSFVGRPFPVAEAAEHLSRLRSWGLTTLRFLVTWEAIEHAGPGLYDTEYLSYVEQIVRRASDMGFTIFIDPHQDVWSRFTGGDGAPGWTLEAAGFDMTHFAETGAAVVHQIHGDPFPHMVWPTNGNRLAAATMFTLFFGGGDFAPAVLVDGESIQEYLQRHYIDAVLQLVVRLKDIPGVIGYDTFNEPSGGYIGVSDLGAVPGRLKVDIEPTPLQAFALGDGIVQDVEVWSTGLTGSRLRGRRKVNEGGIRSWQEGLPCIWRRHGVWDVGEDGRPRILLPDYFSRRNGNDVDFTTDYLAPFVRRYAEAVRRTHPGALLFIEGESGTLPPSILMDPGMDIVSAPHWYDGIQLLSSRRTSWLGVDMLTSKLVVGPWSIRRSFTRQMKTLREAGHERLRAPTVIGEIGVPFDAGVPGALTRRAARRQESILDRSFAAVDDSLVSCMIWNYTAANTNERGDGWNGEDFSIWSADQGRDPDDPDRGGRALRAVVRPYPIATAGEPLRLSFDRRRRILRYTFRHDPAVPESTEIFIPPLQYPYGYRVWMTDGTFLKDENRHVLRYTHTLGRPAHTLIIRPKLAPVGR